MPTAEEEEERAVLEDDDDDDMVGDDTEEDEEEDYEDEDEDAEAAPPLTAASAPPPHPAPANLAVAAEENLNDSTPSTSSSSSSDRAAPNPNPNPCTAADPQNGAIPVLPISTAAPTAAAAGNIFTPSSSDPVPQPSEDSKPVPVAVAVAAVGGGYDDSRRLFQRLWTDEDEITILKGFLEFTVRRGTTFASHQYDTGPFYEEIKKQLQLEFTKNQLVEKLRRLKKKYRNVVGRMRSTGKDFAFKSPHEQAIYDIARNIWSANVKRARDSDDDDLNTPNDTSYTIEASSVAADGAMNSDRRMSRSRRRFRRGTAEEAAAPTVGVPVENSVPATQVPSSEAAAVPGIIEETVKSCLSPLFKELIYSATGGPIGSGAALLGVGLGGVAAALSPLPLSLGGSPASLPAPGTAADEKWKKQHILELEVYLKRIELVRDRIKSTLEELKSSGS